VKVIRYTIAAFFILTISTFSMAAELEISGGGVLHSANGRYVFGQISGYARHQYMLDTQTGRLWKLVQVKDTEATVLEPIPYSTIGGDYSIYPEKTPTKGK
jgi:hypothetical protein